MVPDRGGDAARGLFVVGGRWERGSPLPCVVGAGPVATSGVVDGFVLWDGCIFVKNRPSGVPGFIRRIINQNPPMVMFIPESKVLFNNGGCDLLI